ncbi:hypothetical protein CspeluHIS016_0500560 [Cutaneotrichosporon spelunceum]|uniref:Exosome complex protein n=1 Tax=Cutaneotrichosporon spelunceum TaxID=1672016 RepID=A0AAD3TWY1_9TREE|nr:hypothetical protein CspeluHIS016_0500560 [Cutaneotrichosporon spelunceum]
MDADPAATLRDLDVSLDTIEAALAPLLAHPLNETRSALGAIERAKLDVLVAYTVNNLVWMYLRMRGIEPDTHGVAKELERVRGYYGKVRDAEDGKPTTRTRIDKDAAKRFITHSIGAPTSAAAMAQRQAEAAIRERQAGESEATRANRFRHVAADAGRLSHDEDEDEGMEDESGEGEQGEPIDSEGEAAALLAEVAEEVYDMVPEPAEARVDVPSRRTKRKRAVDLGR